MKWIRPARGQRSEGTKLFKFKGLKVGK